MYYEHNFQFCSTPRDQCLNEYEFRPLRFQLAPISSSLDSCPYSLFGRFGTHRYVWRVRWLAAGCLRGTGPVTMGDAAGWSGDPTENLAARQISFALGFTLDQS